MHFSDYQLIRHLGINPIQPGEQWLAEQRRDGVRRKVVIVRLGREASADPAAVEAFIEATRREAALDRDDIARILDIGHVDGQFYYCRSWIDGMSLRQLRVRLAERGKVLPLEHALFIAKKVAAAIAAAHRARDGAGAAAPVIHGALSSNRVLLTRGGEVVVTGPWAGDRPGRADDVSAVAAIVYELVAGVPIDADRRPRLAAIAPEVPARLDELIERGLSRDPADRDGDIGSVVSTLESIAAELGATSSATELSAWLGRALAASGDIATRRPVDSIEAIERTHLAPSRVARGSISPPPVTRHRSYARVPEVIRLPRPRRRRRKLRRALVVLAVAALLFAASSTITMALL